MTPLDRCNIRNELNLALVAIDRALATAKRIGEFTEQWYFDAGIAKENLKTAIEHLAVSAAQVFARGCGGCGRTLHVSPRGNCYECGWHVPKGW